MIRNLQDVQWSGPGSLPTNAEELQAGVLCQTCRQVWMLSDAKEFEDSGESFLEQHSGHDIYMCVETETGDYCTMGRIRRDH